MRQFDMEKFKSPEFQVKLKKEFKKVFAYEEKLWQEYMENFKKEVEQDQKIWFLFKLLLCISGLTLLAYILGRYV